MTPHPNEFTIVWTFVGLVIFVGLASSWFIVSRWLHKNMKQQTPAFPPLQPKYKHQGQTFFQYWTTKDGHHIQVEYGYDGRHRECVVIVEAWTRDQLDFEMSADEAERFESWIMEHRSMDDGRDYG